MTFKVMHAPQLHTGSQEAKRDEIRRYFQTTWEIYEKLFSLMDGDQAYLTRADPLRHPLIFYLGHTAVFFINKLVLAKSINERVNPRFESIFAIGVDEMSWDDLDEKNYDWPTVDEVLDYRNQVRSVIEKAIADLPLSLPITWDDPFWVILMGIEHERIHLETSSVLIRQLPLDMVTPSDAWPLCKDSGPAPANDLRDVAGGKVVLGKPRDHGLYGWDNEYGRLESEVAPFRASRYLASNAEFREFVDANGYRTERWWTAEGWEWRNFRQAEHPAFWKPDAEGGFRLRCLAEEIPMPWAGKPKLRGTPSACRLKRNGIGCWMYRESRISRSGTGRPGISTWPSMPHRAPYRPTSPPDSGMWWATSGSGPKRRSPVSRAFRCTRCTTIFPPPLSTPGTT